MNKRVLLFYVSIFFLILLFGNLIFLKYYFVDWATRAQFGDSFGVLNSIFSGFGIIGLVYTIYLQNKSLKQSNEQLNQSVISLNENIKQFKIQQKISSIVKLINIYEKKIEYCKSINNQTEISTYNKKVLDLMNELESYLN